MILYLTLHTGATLKFEESSNRQLIFPNITVQNGGILELSSVFGDETDVYHLQVGQLKFVRIVM